MDDLDIKILKYKLSLTALVVSFPLEKLNSKLNAENCFLIPIFDKKHFKKVTIGKLL